MQSSMKFLRRRGYSKYFRSEYEAVMVNYKNSYIFLGGTLRPRHLPAWSSTPDLVFLQRNQIPMGLTNQYTKLNEKKKIIPLINILVWTDAFLLNPKMELKSKFSKPLAHKVPTR